jgi:hypothetical protein
MSRLTDTHQDYQGNFDDFQDDHFTTDLNDLTLKTNLDFQKSKWNLQSTSAFNFLAKNSAEHSWKLSHAVPNCANTWENSNEETSYENVVNFKKVNDDIDCGYYLKMLLNQGDQMKQINYTGLFRFHFKDFFLFSCGFEDHNFSKTTLPNVFSAYGSYGLILDKEVKDPVRLSLNGYLNYNNFIKQLSEVKFFLIGENSKFSSLCELKFENVVEEATKDNSSNLSDHNKAPVVIHNALLNIRVNHSADDDVNVGANFGYNVNQKQADVELMASKKMDRVKVIGKLNSERSMTLGITSKLDDVELNFTAKSTLDSKTTKVEDNELTTHWANFNFGLSAQIERI